MNGTLFFASPAELYGWDYKFFGLELTETSLKFVSPFSPLSVLSIGKRRFDLSREGFFSGRFFMKEDGLVVATAKKNGLFKGSFDFVIDEKDYSLFMTGWLKPHFELFKNKKQTAFGEISRNSFFNLGLKVDIPDEIEIKYQLFVCWLAILLMRARR